MKILILVDIQNGFCPGGGLGVPHGDEVVPVVNALMRSGEYDLVIATADWHPADHTCFAANHPGKKPFDRVLLDGVMQTLWPTHCVQNTKDAELHPGLDRSRIDHIVLKGVDKQIDSLSGFYDNLRKNMTRLHDLILATGVPQSEIELTVCGLATDYCAGLTALDAVDLGYKTTFVIDASRAVNLTPGDDVRMLQQMAAVGIDIKESREILPAMPREVSTTHVMERGLQV